MLQTSLSQTDRRAFALHEHLSEPKEELRFILYTIALKIKNDEKEDASETQKAEAAGEELVFSQE